MLPKRQRLSKRTIEAYIQKSKKVRTEHFLLMYMGDSIKPTPQVSFTVSKKIAPTAVLRNKMRRRGYSAVKPFILKLKKGSQVLVSYTKKAEKFSIEALSSELSEAFSKLRLL